MPPADKEMDEKRAAFDKICAKLDKERMDEIEQARAEGRIPVDEKLVLRILARQAVDLTNTMTEGQLEIVTKEEFCAQTIPEDEEMVPDMLVTAPTKDGQRKPILIMKACKYVEPENVPNAPPLDVQDSMFGLLQALEAGVEYVIFVTVSSLTYGEFKFLPGIVSDCFQGEMTIPNTTVGSDEITKSAVALLLETSGSHPYDNQVLQGRIKATRDEMNEPMDM